MELVVKCFSREKAMECLELYPIGYVTPCDAPDALNLHLPELSELYVTRTNCVVVQMKDTSSFHFNYTDFLNIEIH